MRRIPYYVVDVFTNSPLGGNPLAVFPDRTNLREVELQKIAKELNLSETVFVQEPKAEGALKRLRIFTPAAELPLAGHPVVGTWFLLASRGLVDFDNALEEKTAYEVKSQDQPDKLIVHHELGVGVLPVTIFKEDGEVSGVVMDQAKPAFGEQIKDVSRVAVALGVSKADITSSLNLPQPVSTGMNVLVTPLATRNALAACKPNQAELEKLSRELDIAGIYAFTRDAEGGAETAFVSARGFYPILGVVEDPATGSAAGSLGAYLAKNKIIGGKKTVAFQIEQGVEMGRPSIIGVEITFADNDIERVRVGGSAVVIVEAEMILP